MTAHLTPERRVHLEEMAYGIRRLSVEMITWGQWGHLGGSFSMAELLAVLYFEHMDIRPQDPRWEGRDRLILSKAHGSPGLYGAQDPEGARHQVVQVEHRLGRQRRSICSVGCMDMHLVRGRAALGVERQPGDIHT